MKPEVKAKWLEALRSGNYKQTSSALMAKTNRFCCLGVLADVMGCGWESAISNLRNYPYDPDTLKLVTEMSGFAGPNDFLGPDFLAKVGLLDEEQRELAKLNDSGHSFEEIANVIEEKL